MTKALGYGLTVCGLVAGMALAGDEIGKEGVVVLKFGDTVYVRTWFSPTQHVVHKIGIGGNNRQINFLSGTLVSIDAPMTAEGCEKGILFHSNGDDATPWNLNGTYIGGNHGASDVLKVTSITHGLTDADIGSAWTDEAGVTFYLLQIFGPDEFLVMSENQGDGPVWRFVRELKGNTIARTGTDRTLTVWSTKLTQLWPACRINRQIYLLDGRIAFPDKLPILCDYIDIVEDYDIICPDAVLASVKQNPGKKADFVAQGLDAVVNNQITYRFLPQGACVVHHHSTAKRDFNLGYMGFIQSAKLYQGRFDTHEYYIPKTRPFDVDGKPFDFLHLQDFSFPLEKPCTFSAANQNIADPANLPDRYIQFLGVQEAGGTRRKVAYALGYSLIEGITRADLRAQHVGTPVWIHTSSKTYPQAIDSKMGKVVKAGTVFDCTAYRQYFDAAAAPNATCVYGHYEGDTYVLYADYHASVEYDVLAVPAGLLGRKIEVVEKTPSVTVLSGDTIPAEGLALSVKDGYGYAVVKILKQD